MMTSGKLKRRAAFFEQLAATISAGVPLTKALEMAGRNRSIGIPHHVIAGLVSHMQEGHTFTDAMLLVSGQKRDPAVSHKPRREYTLSDFDVALLSAGEQSGRLDITFKTLARYYRARGELISSTISHSMVTIVTVHVFLLVFPIGLLQAFALGIVNGTYGMCVPFIVEKVVAFGLLYGVVFGLAYSAQANRGETWRSAVESIFHLIPWLRQAVKYLAVARLSMALEALLSAGVPVIQAWELAAAACGSPMLKKELLKRLPEVEVGTTPGEMVGQIEYFPEMFTQLYQTGEVSGKMDETLTHLRTYFEDEGGQKLQIFCRALSWFLYFCIVIVVAIGVIRFWTGYFNAMLNSF